MSQTVPNVHGQRSKRRFPLFAVLAGATLVCALWAAPATAAEHSIGFGGLYWESVDDIDIVDLDEDGIAWVLSYRRNLGRRGLLAFEVDLEYYSDGYAGSADSAYAPSLHLIVGREGLYLGLGIGVTFSSGLADDPSDPFFNGRIGYQFKLSPGLRLDVNGNYRTNSFEALGDFDVDTIGIGATLRLKL